MTDARLEKAEEFAKDWPSKDCVWIRELCQEIRTLRTELSQALATVKFYADGRERMEAREKSEVMEEVY